MPDGSVSLKQNTSYMFRGDRRLRTIDLVITLTAQDKRVSMTDNKEGVLGLRVTRALEEPSDEARDLHRRRRSSDDGCVDGQHGCERGLSDE